MAGVSETNQMEEYLACLSVTGSVRSFVWEHGQGVAGCWVRGARS